MNLNTNKNTTYLLFSSHDFYTTVYKPNFLLIYDFMSTIELILSRIKVVEYCNFLILREYLIHDVFHL